MLANIRCVIGRGSPLHGTCSILLYPHSFYGQRPTIHIYMLLHGFGLSKSEYVRFLPETLKKSFTATLVTVMTCVRTVQDSDI